MSEQPKLDMYNASVPALLRVLSSLKTILTKAKVHVETKKVEESVLLNARIAMDMFPLLRQVQIVTDNAKGAAARLGNVDVPVYDDKEMTFDELLARIEAVKAFVESVPADGFADSEPRSIVLKFGPREFPFTGYSYLTSFVLPNTYFHLTVAYAICRANGVELTKSDYLMG